MCSEHRFGLITLSWITLLASWITLFVALVTVLTLAQTDDYNMLIAPHAVESPEPSNTTPKGD